MRGYDPVVRARRSGVRARTAPARAYALAHAQAHARGRAQAGLTREAGRVRGEERQQRTGDELVQPGDVIGSAPVTSSISQAT
ncbi:MAG TPA: hypothetical protein VMA77_10865 [Solirubrobacteraceae bacterium]|nr:hypothetical protein [Solirubrobacteraceae bacterium]